MLRRSAFLAVLVSPSLAFASSGGGGSMISGIAVAIVAASVLGIATRLFRQPLILGYLLAGVAVGPIGLKLLTNQEQIASIAEIGLILLLFMIGLEIDLKKMLGAGKLVVLTGALQFPLSAALAFGALKLLALLGLPFGEGRFTVLYLAVAVSISSTMIVVKLLYDKLELDTLAGRITLGILVFQDIWAIIVLAIQPNLGSPDVARLAQTFAAGVLLVAAALAASKFVLPRLFKKVAKVPELMVVLSLGWCFAVGLTAAHPRIGLSMEMGALIAGVALATFPYNLDVIAKVLTLRDFFITLFFVALGMQIPFPSPQVIVVALALCAVVWLSRFAGVFAVLHRLHAGLRISLLSTLNLAQMSEFSLVILSLGVSLGHLSAEAVTPAIWTFAVTAVMSTYQIGYSEQLQRGMSRQLKRFGLRDLGRAESEVRPVGHRPIVMLGFYRIADAFLSEVMRRDQHLVDQLKVVDFNPEVRKRLTGLGIPCTYGDISHPDTLHHADIDKAQVILCTIPDVVLRGTTNAKLLKILRQLAPHARLVMTADTPEQAAALYSEGADFVLQPNFAAGESLVTVVEQAQRGSFEGMREEATGKFAVLGSPGTAA